MRCYNPPSSILGYSFRNVKFPNDVELEIMDAKT